MKSQTRTGAPIGTCSDEEFCVPLVCDLCRAEIPDSAAVTFEGSDYAVHFCGLGCLEAWKSQHHIENQDSRSSG